MRHAEEQALLRIHLSNFEKWHTGTLYGALVERAQKDRLAGATVLSGVYGYVDGGELLGEHAGVRVERPLVIEIVDREVALREFLTAVQPMLTRHRVLVTLERAQVVHYRGGDGGGRP